MVTASDAHDAVTPSRVGPAVDRHDASRWHRLRPRNVDLLTAALAGAAATLLLTYVQALPRHPASAAAWFALCGAFALADLARVDIEVGESAATLTLSHTVFVFGLFVVSPGALVGARVVGGIVVLLPYWRRRRRKFFFNTALYGVEAASGVSLFHLICGHRFKPGDVLVWLAALVAVASCSVLTALLVAAAIRLSGGSGPLPLADIVGLGMIGEVANACVGLVAAIVSLDGAHDLLLLAIPAAVLYGAYRGYVRLTERHKGLARLYRFTGELQRTPELFATLRTTIGEASQTLRAKSADVLLVTGGPDGRGLWVTVDGGGNIAPFGDVDERRADEAVAAVIADGAARRVETTPSRIDAVIAPITVRGEVVGALSARGRLGTGTSFTDDDLTVLAALANHAAVSMENNQLTEALHNQAVEAEQQALHDALTGLSNRRAFGMQLHDAIAGAGVDGRAGAVLMIDLRGFKDINETLGHQAGDRLLRTVADRLIGLGHEARCVARLGGDEFAVVRYPCTSTEAMAFANDVRATIEQPIILNSLQLVVSASIGVACFPDQAGDEITLMQRADMALYTAKERPEEPVQLYANQHDRSTARRLTLAADLREALEREELLVYYQPQADLASGDIIAVEALLRWHHPTLGWIAPDEFVAIGEGAGLISKITRYVLRKAVAQRAKWAMDGIDLELSVNISARNLLERQLPNDVAEVLHHHGVRPETLTLEITETEIMREPELTVDVLDRLNDLGVRLSIDDFGTGYSSLAYLRRLPVTEVKIDKSFVLQMDTNANDAMLAQTIVDLAGNLSMRVVAEGIETQASWDQLVRMGCSRGQGFLLARPMPAVDITSLMRSLGATTKVHLATEVVP
jgi:diguanylate cyclase (GGDEF)-like protein